MGEAKNQLQRELLCEEFTGRAWTRMCRTPSLGVTDAAPNTPSPESPGLLKGFLSTSASYNASTDASTRPAKTVPQRLGNRAPAARSILRQEETT
jgi:hypothetical protein